tara:strand:- start:11 stop:733 length:723 start_codon:yes stop_codon:yes gene_type:complete
VKNREIYKIKKLLLIGIFFVFTNILTINIFKKVTLRNLQITGADFITANDIIENSSLQLPRQLIFIKTKLIEKELKKNISLRQISITRQIFPFGLVINIQKRTPVAFAVREEEGIKIKGFIDKDGFFIKEKYVPEKESLIFPIKIFGWRKEYKKLISLIIKTYKETDDLESIKISSEGFITLEEKFLQKIFLGFKTQEIEEKLNLIFDIKEQIKKQNIRKKIESLDLTDLANPKIKVFIP